MTAKLGDMNGIKPTKALGKLMVDSRVEEIEGGGMDEGRVFIHLKRGFCFGAEGHRTYSVGSAKECRYALGFIQPCDCEDCK